MKIKDTLKMPQTPNIIVCILMMLLFSSHNVFSQKEQVWKKTTVLEFSEPYDQITITFDKDDFVFKVSSDVMFTDSKKKSISKEELFVGSTVDISFILQGRKRVLTKVKVTGEGNGKKKSLKGALEYVENEEVAYIDGQKVQLTAKAIIKCSNKKECDCAKGRTFLSFEEIEKGSFLTIQGEVNENGVYMASKVTVCKNVFTDNDQELMASLANSFDATTLTPIKNTSSFSSVSQLHKGEIKIGSLQYKLYDDIEVQGYVNMVGNKILPDYVREESHQQIHDVDFRFYVIENDIPNASAFPNGMIFIHTGLLKLMENEAQLATVLGHEIAHVTHEHGAQRLKSSKKGNIIGKGMKLGGKIFEKNTENALLKKSLGPVIESITPENIVNLFEKGKETQSDRVGLSYIYNAGYDGREAAKFWQIMANNTKNERFMGKVFSKAKDMLNNIEVNDNGKIDVAKIGDDGTNILVNSILETVYASHPHSIKRFGDINKILATTYKDIDFNDGDVGKEDFEKYMKSIKEN